MHAPAFNYEIVRSAPEEARRDLCRLWRENLRLPVPPEDRFDWLYRDAPDPASTVFVLRARSGEATRAVGTNGVAVRRFQLGADAEGRVALSGDLAVDRAHRGLLPALALVKAVRDFASSDFDLAYGFPNPKAEGVMVRAGFRVLGRTTRYARVLRHASYRRKIAERLPRAVRAAARLVANEHVAGALGPIADVARLALDARRILQAKAVYRLAWGTSFDDRFDALWSSARSDYDVVGVRSSTFLKWRFPRADVATLLRRDGVLDAYAIVEHDAETGAAHVRDVFGKAGALGPLFDLLVPALWRRGDASVSVRFLGAPRVARILTARGFARRSERRTVVVHAGARSGPARTTSPNTSASEDAERWHLFDVDEDA